MDQLANASQFTDIAGLDNLRAKAQQDQKGALKEVAHQFESIFVQMLMKSMRDANAVFEADSPFNSQYTKFYEQMHDQQMSVDLSSKGMLGLADLMVQQLDPQDSGVMPASVLRGDTGNLAMQRDSALQMPPQNTADATTVAMPTREAISTRSPVSATVAPTEKSQGETPLAPMLAPELPLTARGDGADIELFAGASTTNDGSTVVPGKGTLEQLLSGKNLPSDNSNVRIGTQEDFVKVLYPYAKDAAERLGTTPEVLLAQSALETGWGQKMLKTSDGQPSNNLFNIKADKRWDGATTTATTMEFEKGTAVKERAAFRVYGSLQDSFNDFVNFISQNDRYRQARQGSGEPSQFIRGLAEAGYATDPQYASKVLKVLQSIKNDFGQLSTGASAE